MYIASVKVSIKQNEYGNNFIEIFETSGNRENRIINVRRIDDNLELVIHHLFKENIINNDRANVLLKQIGCAIIPISENVDLIVTQMEIPTLSDEKIIQNKFNELNNILRTQKALAEKEGKTLLVVPVFDQGIFEDVLIPLMLHFVAKSLEFGTITIEPTIPENRFKNVFIPEHQLESFDIHDYEDLKDFINLKLSENIIKENDNLKEFVINLLINFAYQVVTDEALIDLNKKIISLNFVENEFFEILKREPQIKSLINDFSYENLVQNVNKSSIIFESDFDEIYSKKDQFKVVFIKPSNEEFEMEDEEVINFDLTYNLIEENPIQLFKLVNEICSADISENASNARFTEIVNEIQIELPEIVKDINCKDFNNTRLHKKHEELSLLKDFENTQYLDNQNSNDQLSSKDHTEEAILTGVESAPAA